ncbi:MAG: tyrosine-protein phosphatase [Clostridia bacterium]|nr:tyrosine-protein phosphatase [Clostridia bacterium]
MKRLFIVLVAIVVTILSACSAPTDLAQPRVDTPELDGSKIIMISNPGATVDFHSPSLKSYLADSVENISTYASGKKEKSFPRATTLSWTANFKADGYTVEYYPVDRPDEVISVFTLDDKVNLYNLYVGSAYAWKVKASVGGGVVTSAEGRFSTSSAAPRNLYIDGVTNARDLGGWNLEQGGKVRQGLIFRTGRINTSWYNTVNAQVTEFGIKTMLETLRMRSELDLRKDYENEVSLLRECVLGDTVKYYPCPMEYTDLKANVQTVCHVFELLADRDNYPLFFHCDIGTDRTGYIAFLINGVLGVSEQDLNREYLLSNFGNIGSSRSLSGIKSAYVNEIKACSGATLKDKVENHLLGLGVKKTHIDALREYMTEGAV